MAKVFASIFVVLLATSVSLLAASLSAQGEGDLRKTVREIAEHFSKAEKNKSNTKAATELAAKTGKSIDKTSELMAMFRPRDDGGVGVGAVAGKNPAKDGIEAMIRDLSTNVPFAVLKDIAAIEEMGYTIAAMGAIVDAKGPPKTADAKAAKLWHEYAHDTHLNGLAFARAAADKKPATIKMAALKVRTSCGGCHAFFK